MTSDNSFISMLRQIRGTNPIGEAVSNGMWFDIQGWYTEIGGATPTSGLVYECTQAQLAAEAARDKAQDWATSSTAVEVGMESAKTYAGLAGVSAGEAEDAETLAKSWATSSTDVEAGLSSAKTYAESAGDSEALIELHSDGIDAVADIVATTPTAFADVSDIKTEIVEVATIDDSVVKVAGSNDEVVILGTTGNVTSMSVLGTTSNVSNMATVSASIVDVNAVAAIDASVDTVAGISTDVTKVAGVSVEVGLLGNTATIEDLGLLGTAATVGHMNVLGSTAVTDDMEVVANDIDDVRAVAAINDADSTLLSRVGTIDTEIVAVAAIDDEVVGVDSVKAEVALLGVSVVVANMGLLGTTETVADMDVIGEDIADINLVAANTGLDTQNNPLPITVVATDLTDPVYSDIANAKGNAELAKKWANEDQGTEVEYGTGLYSSMSYALDAKGYRDEMNNLSPTTSNVANIPSGDPTIADSVGVATSTYNSSTNELALGIPVGVGVKMTNIVAESGVNEGRYTWHFSAGIASFTTNDLTGPQGPVGDDGESLAMTSVNNNGDGTYTWNFSAGNPYTTGDLTGPQGAIGTSIESVYWLRNVSGEVQNTQGTTDVYGCYSSTEQIANNLISEFTVWNGANGGGAGDMLKTENLSGMADYAVCRTNLSVDSSAMVDSKVLIAVPSQTGNAGMLLQTDGTDTSWGYNPAIGSW